MGKTTISWADYSFNPWWGCTKVSEACTHCYAETFSKRVGLKVWGNESPRRLFGPAHWQEPLKWNAKAKKDGVRRRVFCASMADVFEDRDDLEQSRIDLFLTIEKTPHLDWLLLTKRPENIERMLQVRAYWRNVWLGTTVESQAHVNRISHLLSVPAVVHFISYEPALGPLNLEPWLQPDYTGRTAQIDWVIAGGESGGHARPSRPEWFCAVRDQCTAAGVPFHFKQWGEWTPGVNVDRRCGVVRTASWFNDIWRFGAEDLTNQEGHIDDEPDLYRVGKKEAGRILDGCEWLEFPTQQEISR